MTRWAMVADLRRCVGCQTCTAACRHANATPPGVQWRRVLDMEFGEYPDVQRAFVPVGCQHCDDPPCMDVCPTTATRKRDDGIVTIDYDLCIGCAYCAVACPYQARYKTLRAGFAYGTADGQRDEAPRRRAARGGHQVHVLRRAHRRRPGERASGPASIRKPRPPASMRASRRRCSSAISTTRRATCRSCSPRTSTSGCTRSSAPDPASTTCGTRRRRTARSDPSAMHDTGPSPWQQTNWDWRAAGNFICGGAGGGLVVFTALSARRGCAALLLLAGLAFVGVRARLRVARARPAAAGAERLPQSAHVVDGARG